MKRPTCSGSHHVLEAVWALGMLAAVTVMRRVRSSLCIAFGGVTVFALSYKHLFWRFGGAYTWLSL